VRSKLGIIMPRPALAGKIAAKKVISIISGKLKTGHAG
jgi:hypothetical protein